MWTSHELFLSCCYHGFLLNLHNCEDQSFLRIALVILSPVLLHGKLRNTLIPCWDFDWYDTDCADLLGGTGIFILGLSIEDHGIIPCGELNMATESLQLLYQEAESAF